VATRVSLRQISTTLLNCLRLTLMLL